MKAVSKAAAKTNAAAVPATGAAQAAADAAPDAAPVAATAPSTTHKSSWCDEIRAARLAELPDEAQPEDGAAGRQSYTLRREGITVSIGILLKCRAFYVSRLDEIPSKEGEPIWNETAIDIKKGLNMNWGDSAREVWAVAKQVAGWDQV